MSTAAMERDLFAPRPPKGMGPGLVLDRVNGANLVRGVILVKAVVAQTALPLLAASRVLLLKKRWVSSCAPAANGSPI